MEVPQLCLRVSAGISSSFHSSDLWQTVDFKKNVIQKTEVFSDTN